MKYYYKKPESWTNTYGTIKTDCPYAVSYTLYSKNNMQLGVVQQRFNPNNKSYIWTSIDPWLIDAIYEHPQFDNALIDWNGRIVSVRTLMWKLRMKPLAPKEWESPFAK